MPSASRQASPAASGGSAGLLALPGIGPARAAALAEAGVRTPEDLLTLAPRRWEDRRRFTTLADLERLPPGTRATVLVRVVSSRLIRTRRRGFSLTRARVADGSGAREAVWFNQPFLARHLTPGRELILYGALAPFRSPSRPGGFENPELEMAPAGEGDEPAVHMGRIVPVYRRIGSLSPRRLRGLMHRALAGEPPVGEDPVPPGLARKRGWPPRERCLRELHFPPADADLEAWSDFRSPALKRLVFEELLVLQAALELRRLSRRRLCRSWTCRIDGQRERRWRSVLPFRLTAGQEAAWKSVAGDMQGPAPMARLLQGDVGSGKTAVAILAMQAAADSGVQAALMAPTEVLADQHHRQLSRLLGPAGFRVERLRSGLAAAERRRVRAELAEGRAPLVVGTHALLQDDVLFSNLGLVVIDEQHRFGVEQRLALARKGRRADLLVMTATPIPRSLALTRYGDLDLVEIRERPPGRMPVSTEVWPRRRRAAAWARVREEVAAGGQAYVVYPVVAESADPDLAAAEEACRELAAGPLAGLSVALLHGRLPAQDKAAVISGFAAGRVQVLVCTTVIEVGVDVPAASLMVVEHAERFGLAQLHQLRGRVGRGRRAATCLLLHGARLGDEARRRLEVVAATDDGFALAREDLRLRGPGEMMGRRQSGAPGLRLADLVRDEALLEEAREWAVRLVAEGPDAALEAAARRRWGDLLDPSAAPGAGLREQGAASPPRGSGRR